MRIQSASIPLQSKAPDFKLNDSISNEAYSLSNCRGKKGLVVAFLDRECTYVDFKMPELVRIANDYRVLGFGFVAINSSIPKNAKTHQLFMWNFAQEHDFTFPFLWDKNQLTAKNYSATCYPEFFVYDESLRLVYHGQMDNSRPKNGIPVTGRDLRESLDNLLNNRQFNTTQKPAEGCAINLN